MLKDENATTGYDLLMAAENDEERKEISRLLYVATTRAADYLILSAGVEEPGKADGPVDGIARNAVRSEHGSGKRRGRGRGKAAFRSASRHAGSSAQVSSLSPATDRRSNRSRSIFAGGAI